MRISCSKCEYHLEDIMIQPCPGSPYRRDTIDFTQSDLGTQDLGPDLSSPWGNSVQTTPWPNTFDLTRPLPQLPKEVILQIMRMLDPLSQFLFSLTASEYRREYNHYKLGGVFHNNIWPIYPRSDSWLVPVPKFKWPSMIDDRISKKDSVDPNSWYCSVCKKTMHRKHWKKCELEREIDAWDTRSKNPFGIRDFMKPSKSKTKTMGRLAGASFESYAHGFKKTSRVNGKTYETQSIWSMALKPPSEIVWDLLTSIRTSNPLYASLLREERKYNDSKLPLDAQSNAEEMHRLADEEDFRIKEFGDDCDVLVSIGVAYWNCGADWPLCLDDLSAFEKDGGKYWVPWEEIWKKLRI
ncbi:hypothetical protein ACMFMF_007137 [Clarireedia jacksonii]